MGGVINALGDAFDAAADAVGSAVGAVTGGLSSAVGDVADAIGLPSQVGDALENFTDIGLGGLTGGIGTLAGAIDDVAGFPDPVGFFENAAGELGGLATDLLPGLGSVFGTIGDSGFPFADMLGGAAENLIGSNGILSGIIGGAESLIGNLLPPFDPSKVLPSVLNGAGSVLQNLFNQIPQLSNILGGANPLGALGNLFQLTQNLNPSDVLNALKNGLLKLAENFPSPSKQLNDVLAMLLNFGKAGIDPHNLLQTVSAKLASIPELSVPMMPFNPVDMLAIPGFANQFLGSLGQPPLPSASLSQAGPEVLESTKQALAHLDPAKLAIEARAGSIRPEILKALPDLTAVTAGGGQTPSGEQALFGALEKNMDSINDIMNQLANLDPESKDYQKNMMQLQMKMQQLQQMQMMISEILKNFNDLKETIIRNLGA